MKIGVGGGVLSVINHNKGNIPTHITGTNAIGTQTLCVLCQGKEKGTESLLRLFPPFPIDS